MRQILFLLMVASLMLFVGCGSPTPSIEELEAALSMAAQEYATIKKENAALSKEASSLRTSLAKLRETHANLKAEHEALSTASTDEKTARIIADLEERLEEAFQDNKQLAAEVMARQNALKNTSTSNAEARPPAPVNLSGFSEPEIISDLCYLVASGSYTSAAVASILIPDITNERLNAAILKAANSFGHTYPHTRANQYVSLTQWTYCTLPYFDEAHHAKMRQIAQDRVDALESRR